MSIFIYKASSAAISRLNLSSFSNSNPNSGRYLFLNYINPIGSWGPKPNDKTITSITSSLSFVLELPNHIPKTIYKKNALVNAYWNVKPKFEL